MDDSAKLRIVAVTALRRTRILWDAVSLRTETALHQHIEPDPGHAVALASSVQVVTQEVRCGQ